MTKFHAGACCVQNLTALASAIREMDGAPKFKMGHMTT